MVQHKKGKTDKMESNVVKHYKTSLLRSSAQTLCIAITHIPTLHMSVMTHTLLFHRRAHTHTLTHTYAHKHTCCLHDGNIVCVCVCACVRACVRACMWFVGLLLTWQWCSVRIGSMGLLLTRWCCSVWVRSVGFLPTGQWCSVWTGSMDLLLAKWC